MPGSSHSGAYQPQHPNSYPDYAPPPSSHQHPEFDAAVGTGMISFEDEDNQDKAVELAQPPATNIDTSNQNQAMLSALMAQSSAEQPTCPTAAASISTDLLQLITPQLMD